jgi:hypothetical protein
VTTDTSTYAIDAATCRRIWHTAKSYEKLGFLKNNHGVAFMDGRPFRVHGGVHEYALDRAPGARPRACPRLTRRGAAGALRVAGVDPGGADVGAAAG